MEMQKAKYESPRVEELGKAAVATQSGVGDTNDGADQPPQSFFTDQQS